MRPSRINCQLYSRRNSRLGAAIKVAVDTTPWRSFECRKDYLFGKLFRSRSSRNIQWRKYLHDVIQKTIEFSIPPKRFRFWLSDDGECHSYLQARHLQARHLIQCFLNILAVQSGFYTLKRFRFGLSGIQRT